MDWLDEIVNKTDECVRALASTEQPLILFGSGDKGRGAHKILSEKGIKIECFCDNNSALCLTDYRNTHVYSYDMIRYLYPRYTMLLTITKTKTRVVRTQLASYNDRNKAVHFCIPFDLADMLISAGFMKKEKDAFSFIHDRLADDTSRAVLREALLYKATGNADHVFTLTDGGGSFDELLAEHKYGTAYLDLYYSNLDGIFQFLSFCGGNYGSITAVSPVRTQYEKLLSAVQTCGIHSAEIHNAAYWNDPDILNIPFVYWNSGNNADATRFVYDNEGISHLSLLQKAPAKYAAFAEVTSADKILNGRKASLIRITSIGNDFEIINGLKNTILDYKPAIIMEYGGSASDLTSVPLFLWKLKNDYKIYLREKLLGESYKFILYAL
jgi:FkbM family methyltransferase